MAGKVIGITGGIGSGKSTVAKMLQEMGAALIDADVIAKAMLRQADVKGKIERTWGGGVFTAEGEVDRKALAGSVFANADQLARLNAIMHPPVIRRIEEDLHRQKREEPERPVVVDAALLQEVGLSRVCDVVVFVDVEKTRRRERMRWRRGWDDEEVERRERFQMPLAEKRMRADYVIDNNWTEAETRNQVEAFWRGISAGG